MNTSLRNRCLGLAVLLSVSAVVFAQEPPPPARFAGPPPVRMIHGDSGNWVYTARTGYRVVSVESGLRDYKQHFNQAGRKLHPGFASDRLAVVVIEVKNSSERPLQPPVFAAALTDSEGIRGTEWSLDARQEAYVRERHPDGLIDAGRPAQIGPGQTMKIALVFSISAKAVPTSIEFSPENFRDMPFGQPGGPRLGAGGGTPGRGQIGPRGGNGQRPEERISIALAPAKRI